MKRLLIVFVSILVDGFLLARTLVWTVPATLLRVASGKIPPGGKGETELGNIAGEARGRPYMVVLSFVEWDGAWQRPQHLATRLAPNLPVVYCAPVRAHNAIGRVASLLLSARERVSEGLDVLRPLVLPAENRFRWVAALNDLIVYDALRREIRRRGAAPQVLMANSPFFARVFSLLPAQVRVYDVMDELVRFPWAPPDARERESRLADQCDLITTGTLSLERLKRSQYRDVCREVLYVACGVDADRFAPPPPDAPLTVPDDVARLPRPVLGFFGAINERVDPDVLAALAQQWPESSIVLIGPVYRAFAESEKRLRAFRNIHFLGPRPYGDLPRYLAAFDCALIPYRLSEGIEFVQPVKVLEYMAGGKPVVSTRIPDVVELYGGLARIADSPDAFVALARDAVSEGATRAHEYVRAAQGRSWDAMAREFERLFEKVAQAGKPVPQESGGTPAPQQKTGGAPVLRIAHLLHGTHLGGAEQVVMNLCRHHDPARYEAMVVCLGEGDTVRRRLEERGVRYRVVPMKSKTDLAVALRLIDVLRAEKIDLVHTHTGRTNLVGRIVSRVAGIPTVATVHTAVARDINDFGRTNRVNAWVECLTRGASERLICVSQHNRREILRRGIGRTPSDRVLHIPNGVEDPCPNVRSPGFSLPSSSSHVQSSGFSLPSSPTRIVGMVASMRPRKGPEVLLRAMALLAQDFADLRLLMVGSGEFVEKCDYLATLKDLARDLGIAGRVVFTGHRNDVSALISSMDVFVLPSLFGEGMPLVLLEAMAQGKPLVVSRTEGNDEVVRHGVNGFLVAPGSSKELAKYVAALLNDPDSARAMGRKGREMFDSEYRIEIMARRYEAVYDEMLRDSEVRGSQVPDEKKTSRKDAKEPRRKESRRES